MTPDMKRFRSITVKSIEAPLLNTAALRIRHAYKRLDAALGIIKPQS